MGRTPCCEKNGVKKGPWTPEEDKKLVDYIQRHGHGSWRSLPKRAELLRCGKSCRLRWTNYLRPDIKRGNFSFEEEHMIIELHALLGNKWSAIAASLPGRTDNEIKNYWNTHLRKRLLQMGIDPVTHRPRTDILGFSNMQSPFVSPALSCHMLQLENARLEEYLKLVTAHETVNMAAADCGNVFMMPLNPQLGDSMNKSVFNSVADPAWPAQPAIANSDYNGLIPQNLGQTVQPKKVDTECLINQINAHSSLIQDQEGSVSSFLDSACSSGVGKSSSSSLQIDHVQHAISPMDGMQLKIKHEMILQGHGRILNDKPCEAKMNATANMKVLHDNSTLMDGDYIAPTQQAGNSYARAIPPELMLKLAENSSAQQNAVAIGLASSISTGVAAPFSSELNSQDAKDYWRIMLKSVETKPSDPPAVRSATSQ